MQPTGNARWLEFNERLREMELQRAAAGAASADSAAGGEPPPTPRRRPPGAGAAASAAGRADPPPRSDPKRRAASRPDDGTRREEDLEDWVPEVPYIEEVMQLIHILRWPGVVQRIDGWTCVVVPCYADLADALEHNLLALGAVAPASEPGAGAGADRGAGAPTRAGAAPPEETHPALAEDILPDAEEVDQSADSMRGSMS